MVPHNCADCSECNVCGETITELAAECARYRKALERIDNEEHGLDVERVARAALYPDTDEEALEQGNGD